MANQSQFFSRALFSTRFTQILQISGLKSKATDKIKELKIPDRPKRPLPGYFKFAQTHREVVRAQHPEWKLTDVTRQIALDWKALDLAVKKKYEDGYKAEFEEYAKKYAVYSEKLTEEQKEALAEKKKEVRDAKSKRKLKKRVTELKKPKQPMGAYMLFVTAEAKRQGKEYKDMIQEGKEAWGLLSETDKSKYLETAQAMRDKYEEELREWEWKMIEEGNEDIVRKKTLDLRQKPKSEALKTPPPKAKKTE